MADANETKKAEVQSDDMQKRIADLENQNKTLLKEAMEKKDQIRQLEETRKAEEEKALKEQNKFRELYESAQPKLERLNKLEPTLNSMLELEVNDVPEDKRDLIPAFSQVEDKILWIRNAKSKGLFSAQKEPEKKSAAASVQSKTNSSATSQEFLTWQSSDPRLTQLTISEYQLWKQHNRREKSGIKGWGG